MRWGVVAGCATIAFWSQAPNASARQPGEAPMHSTTPARARIVPLIDVHQHMMSAEAQKLPEVYPDLPTVTLPADLDALLRAREKAGGLPPVGALFADDAVILEWEQSRWIKGHDRINNFMNFNPKNATFIPKSYSIDAGAGSIAGTIRIGTQTKDAMSFFLGIRKNAAGNWQIVQEATKGIPPPIFSEPVEADRIIGLLDDAGIRYAMIQSVGYWFGSPGRNPPVQDQAAKTRAENDWTVAQTARYPDRLIPFCGVNPLTDYAIAEMERCAAIPRVKGIKIHLANIRFKFDNPEHVERLRKFFSAANARRMPIFAHFPLPYTAETGEKMLSQIISSAPDTQIQVAHMGNSWSVAKVFANAIAAGDPRTRNLSFDLTQSIPFGANGQTPEYMSDVAATLRKIGLGRIYYGSDMDVGGNPPPRSWWKAFSKLPLTDAELQDIADNLPPYIRK